MIKKRKWLWKLVFIAIAVISVLVLFPIIYMVCNSFMSPGEVAYYYGLTDTKRVFHLLPDKFSLRAYYDVFLAKPDYLLRFWKSVVLCSVIAFGQVCVGCAGGLAFAKYKFTGRKALFCGMVLFMLLPLQVTLLPNYIILEKLNFLNSWKALVFPNIFSPFGTVFMTMIFRSMPTEWMEAASLDGAGKFQILTRVMMPEAKAGISSLLVLGFVDCWNMVEQPIIFLKDVQQYPLSVFLSTMRVENLPFQFVCGILSLVPVTLIFFYYKEELMEGIGAAIGK